MAAHEQALAAVSIAASKACSTLPPRVANPCLDEPDARIAHVRICGSPEPATARGHPTGLEVGEEVPTLYDLVINTDVLQVDQAVGAIVATARA